MSVDFSKVKSLTIPEGVVTQITDASGRVLWKLETSKPVVLQVEKITSNTYAGETTYTAEEFILLDIYPKTNGTVSVTYGGLTKTITDTSGAEEPNAQQVFFGTFNGVSDSEVTPTSGELVIEGDCYSFGSSTFTIKDASKGTESTNYCVCVAKIDSFGSIEHIATRAFIVGMGKGDARLSGELIIPGSIKSIGAAAFSEQAGLTSVTIGDGVTIINTAAFSKTSLETLTMLAETPPTLLAIESNDETKKYNNFGEEGGGAFGNNPPPQQIIVPKGCSTIYKTADGWSTYADYIVEAL